MPIALLALTLSAFAIGVAIGAPVLTALTGKVPRKLLLLSLMVLLTLGNLLAWQAPGYESLGIARIVTGLETPGEADALWWQGWANRTSAHPA